MAQKTHQEKYPDRYFTSPIGHPRDRIRINENPELPKEGIFMSLNGFAFLAKAGVDIDLPRPVRLMLDTRIKTETTQDESGKDHVRNINRITYQLIKEDVEGLLSKDVPVEA